MTDKYELKEGLLSNCCASDFNPFGYEKEEGIYQEKCLNCGKLCEPIYLSSNVVANIRQCAKWNKTPFEEKKCEWCDGGNGFHEQWCKKPLKVEDRTAYSYPNPHQPETEKCECDVHTGTPVRCPWCPIHGDYAKPHQPEKRCTCTSDTIMGNCPVHIPSPSPSQPETKQTTSVCKHSQENVNKPETKPIEMPDIEIYPFKSFDDDNKFTDWMESITQAVNELRGKR